jgi:hypothetical protein
MTFICNLNFIFSCIDLNPFSYESALNIFSMDIESFIFNIFILSISMISITSIILISKGQKIIKTLGQIGGSLIVGICTTESALNLYARYTEYSKKESRKEPSSE